MSKLLSTLLAAAAMLALSGTVSAADQPSRDTQTQAQPNATQDKPGQQQTDRMPQSQDGSQQSHKGAAAKDSTQGGQSQNGAQTGTSDDKMGRNHDQAGGGEMEAKDKQYSADLKKCNSMKGAKMQKCMDAAEKKHGHM